MPLIDNDYDYKADITQIVSVFTWEIDLDTPGNCIKSLNSAGKNVVNGTSIYLLKGLLMEPSISVLT